MSNVLDSPNFGFLAIHDPLLVRFAAQAEGHIFIDPETALFKLRSWVEALTKQIASVARIPDVATLDLLGLLRRLTEKGYLPHEAADLLHSIRTAGNRAVHDAAASQGEALCCLRFAHKAAIWLHKAYGGDPDWRTAPSCATTADPFSILLAALRTQGGLARADAQAATGRDAATVRPLLQRLVAEGAAKVEGQKRGIRYVAT